MALTTFEDARQCVLDASRSARLLDETVPVELAYSRILAENVSAPFALPGFDHAAMDGYAIAAPALQLPAELIVRVVGRTLAGDPPFGPLSAGEAVQIATGAMLPQGTERVVPVESSEELDDDRVRLRLSAVASSHIRGAEDDYRSGQIALIAGSSIGFAASGVMASFGLREVRVSRRPRVSVLITGSELVPAGGARTPGRIYDSNGALLRGLLLAEGLEAQMHGPLPDNAQGLRAALLAASACSEVVITTGGASAGVADFMPRLLAELGEVLIWKVAMRPGMPLLFARIGRTLVFGLPGNPVSVVAVFLSLVRPALRVMQGASPPLMPRARLLHPLQKTHNRLEFRRATLSVDDQGVAQVQAHPALSSGVLRSVAESDAMILLDAQRMRWEIGDLVEVLRYSSV
ncbi:MAG: molybdopterin molybdotransferase MoeA [Pseudomonadota bacterium]|nr:molybdopterin molybdotransferase MoeA [Pseudomonadota bacterium]